MPITSSENLWDSISNGATTFLKYTDASSFWIPPPSPSRSIPFLGPTYQYEKECIKLHTVFDFEQSTPDFVHLTNGNVPDCIAAREINLSKGCIVVADRGYVDFKLLQHWDSCGVKFVVRHTKSINFLTIQEWDLPDEYQNVLKDEVIAMQGEQSKIYTDIMRRVVAHNDEGNYDVEILSNDFELDVTKLQLFIEIAGTFRGSTILNNYVQFS